ncbi:FecR family protein [Ekhidna sp.]
MNWEQDDIFLSKWLNGELSEEERLAFESTEEGKEFIQLMKASKMIKPSIYDVESALSDLNRRIEANPKQVQKQFWLQTNFQLAVAASVALIVAVVYLFTLGDQDIQTGYSEQEIVLLPDGSEVKVNAASQLSYAADSWEENRSINLVGEAFFKVKKGSTFDVKTINGNVQVLGTSFNVRSRRNMLDVICYTGKVAVTAENTSKQLTPGQMIRIKDGEMIEFKVLDLGDEPTWTNGITTLENVDLPVVLDELNHVFGITVEYDGSLDHLSYTGAFPNQQVEAALKLVFEPLDIAYSFDPSSKELVIHGLNK